MAFNYNFSVNPFAVQYSRPAVVGRSVIGGRAYTPPASYSPPSLALTGRQLSQPTNTPSTRTQQNYSSGTLMVVGAYDPYPEVTRGYRSWRQIPRGQWQYSYNRPQGWGDYTSEIMGLGFSPSPYDVSQFFQTPNIPGVPTSPWNTSHSYIGGTGAGLYRPYAPRWGAQASGGLGLGIARPYAINPYMNTGYHTTMSSKLGNVYGNFQTGYGFGQNIQNIQQPTFHNGQRTSSAVLPQDLLAFAARNRQAVTHNSYTQQPIITGMSYGGR